MMSQLHIWRAHVPYLSGVMQQTKRDCVSLYGFALRKFCVAKVIETLLLHQKWPVNLRLFVKGRSERPPSEGRYLGEGKEKFQNSHLSRFA